MLNTFMQLLGEDRTIFRRYLWMTLGYGLVSGLTIAMLVPLLTSLLTDRLGDTWVWLALQLMGVILCWYWRYRVERVGVQVGVSLLQSGRHRLGEHVARLPVGWFSRHNTARLEHVVTQGVMSLAQLPAHVLTPLISGGVSAVVLLGVLCVLHPALGLMALIVMPLLGLALRLTERLAHQADQQFHRNFAEASQRMVEFAQAQSVLRAFNGSGDSARFLKQAISQQRQASTRLICLSTLAAVFNVWAVQLVLALLLTAAMLWLNQQTGGILAPVDIIGSMIALLVLVRFIDSLQEIVSYGEVVRTALGQLEATGDILTVPSLPEPASPQTPQDASIELQDVRFRYAGNADDVLRGVSLRVAPGSMTALIGASGSGKTTLVRLMARFFDVDQGQVRVGGVDVRQQSGEDLANSISQIFQDTYLFAGSIADNIRMGRAGASDAEVIAALQQAGGADIIERLPEGLHTEVGEGGARLSGGERQRITIARALIKEAPILLVDEATAALDTENQAVIADVLAQLRGQRTLVVIAHQLETIACADQVVVLEHGCVVEQGSPVELQRSGGRYSGFLNQRTAAKGWCITPAASQGVCD